MLYTALSLKMSANAGRKDLIWLFLNFQQVALELWLMN